MTSNLKKQINNRINYQINNNEYLFINNFFKKKYLGKKCIYQKFINQKLIHNIISDSILWNNQTKQYLLFNYQELSLDKKLNKEILNRGRQLNYNFFIHPTKFIDENFLPENLKTDELQKFLQHAKRRGIKNLNLYFNELYQRSSLPFSAFILTILAFLLSSIKNHSNDLGKNIVLGIIISFFYIFLMELFKSISIHQNESYRFIIYIPNIIFSVIVLFLLLIRNKE